MGRVKPSWLQKREFDRAVARENYYETKVPTTTTTVNPRPMNKANYVSLLVRAGTAHAIFSVPISADAVTFFGGLPLLGLNAAVPADTVVPNAPRNFKPAKIHAMVGASTPVAKINPWGSRVIKYSAATAGASQAHYSAPIGSSELTPTIAEVDAKVAAIKLAKSGAINPGGTTYGKLYWTPEFASFSQI